MTKKQPLLRAPTLTRLISLPHCPVQCHCLLTCWFPFFEIQLKYEGIFLKLFKRLQKNVYLLCVFWFFLNPFSPVSANISVYICNYMSLQMQFSTILKPAGYTRFLSSFLSWTPRSFPFFLQYNLPERINWCIFVLSSPSVVIFCLFCTSVY